MQIELGGIYRDNRWEDEKIGRGKDEKFKEGVWKKFRSEWKRKRESVLMPQNMFLSIKIQSMNFEISFEMFGGKWKVKNQVLARI